MTEAENKEVAAREEKISNEQAAMERRRKGRKSTILTGPLGLEDRSNHRKENFIRRIKWL
jgi:hypothetical protein